MVLSDGGSAEDSRAVRMVDALLCAVIAGVAGTKWTHSAMMSCSGRGTGGSAGLAGVRDVEFWGDHADAI
jgi:hypothetical protein